MNKYNKENECVALFGIIMKWKWCISLAQTKYGLKLKSTQRKKVVPFKCTRNNKHLQLKKYIMIILIILMTYDIKLFNYFTFLKQLQHKS